MDAMDMIGHLSLKGAEIIGLLFLLVGASVNYYFDARELIAGRRAKLREKYPLKKPTTTRKTK